MNPNPDLSNVSCVVSHLKFSTGGREYHWEGGFGSVFSSYEPAGSAPKPGDVREIAGLLFTAFSARRDRWGQPFRVCWTVPGNGHSAEWIRELKAAIFS